MQSINIIKVDASSVEQLKLMFGQDSDMRFCRGIGAEQVRWSWCQLSLGSCVFPPQNHRRAWDVPIYRLCSLLNIVQRGGVKSNQMFKKYRFRKGILT